MQLPIDTGSFAILIEEGKYLPSATSTPTNLSEFIQFNGASEDGTASAEVRTFASSYPLGRHFTWYHDWC